MRSNTVNVVEGPFITKYVGNAIKYSSTFCERNAFYWYSCSAIVTIGAHLIGRDKGQVEEEEDGGVHHLSQNGPPVIFFVRDQVAVATLPPKVIGESCAPDRYHDGNDCQPDVGDPFVIEIVMKPEHPRVHHWGDGPNLVYLRDVVTED